MLTTAQRVKDRLVGIGENVPVTHEVEIDRLISSLSAEFVSKTGRTLAKTTHTEEYTGRADLQVLHLNNWPIRSITIVTVDGTTITAGTESNQYKQLKNQRGEAWALFREEGWLSKAYGITITYEAGYVLPAESGANVPDDIMGAVTELAATFYLQRGKSGLTTVSFEGLSQTFDRWPFFIKDVVRAHRRPSI